MSVVPVVLQRADVTIPTGELFPIYTGFMTPVEILKVSEVPSYDGWRYDDAKPPNVVEVGASHKKLANNLKVNPTDEWQRPLNHERKTDISAYYNATKKRLMANPVLLGESPHITGAQAGIGTPAATGGENQVRISFTNNGKNPLLILDGQHRIFGLHHGNHTKNQPIPVVILIKEPAYEKKFLAQIFTEVTTGALKLDDLHQWWMKYTFEMKPFNKTNMKSAMKATIQLCTITTLDAQDNEFLNQIKFNPTENTKPGPWNVTYSCIDWTKKFSIYFDNVPNAVIPMTDSEIAKAAIRFIRAAKENDSVANNSKIFGTLKKPHTILRDELINNFMLYCAKNSAATKNYTKSDWKTKILDPGKWSTSNWTIPFSNVKGGLSSSYGAASTKAANWHFNKMFFDHAVMTNNISTMLKCGTHKVRIVANVNTPNDKMSTSNATKGTIIVGDGESANLNSNTPDFPDIASGAKRKWIRILIQSDDCPSTLVSVSVKDSGTYTSKFNISNGEKSAPIDLNSLTSPLTVEASICGYSKGSERTMNIDVDF